MTLPNFLIIGAQKAGTTWLAKKLCQHPDVFMPSQEIHFFNLKSNFRKGIDRYENHFANARNRAVIGEKTPNYLWIVEKNSGNHLPNIHRNIHKHIPDAKLVVIVRNPVDRLISAVNHYRRYGEFSPFWNIDDIILGSKKS